MKKRTSHEDHLPVSADLAYWLEHIVHWHLLLLAMIAAVAFCVTFFG